MTATFTYGSDPSFGFGETLSLLASGIVGGSIVQQDTTTYSIENDGRTFTFTGTGFTYITIGGQSYISGGTIDGIAVTQGGSSLGALTKLNLAASDLTTAVLDETFGFNTLALENLFLTQPWEFVGDNTAQVLTEVMLSADGVSFSPSGNDIAILKGGDDIFATGAGDDSIFGGSGRDQLFGGEGDDFVNGGSGRDQLFGGNGDDTIDGAGAKDFMEGGFGDDEMYGGSDDDIMYGQKGRDLMYGDDGDDLMFGGSQGGTDIMYGGNGNDTMFGGNQRDKMYGDAGNDTMNGDLGNDQMFGGAGADVMNGGAGNDRMYGVSGDNTIEGGAGHDRMYSGADADTFVFNSQTNTGNDTVFGYDSSTDTLDINDTSFVSLAILTDQVTVTHSGGTITLNDFQIANVAEYNALLDSFDITFDDIFAVG